MPLLSTSEVARLLGVAPMTVRNLADNGALPCRRTAGGHRRFSEADVLAFQGRPASPSAASHNARAAAWAAAATGVLRSAAADLGPSTEAGAAFAGALALLEAELARAARGAAPGRPRRQRDPFV